MIAVVSSIDRGTDASALCRSWSRLAGSFIDSSNTPGNFLAYASQSSDVCHAAYGSLVGVAAIPVLPGFRDTDSAGLLARLLRELADGRDFKPPREAQHFLVIVWDSDTKTLRAWRDPLGLMSVFVAQSGGAIVVSNSLDAFGSWSKWSEDFVAEFIACGGDAEGHTVRADVRQVPPGSEVTWHEGTLGSKRFWSPAAYSGDPDTSPNATGRFRELMLKSVAKYIAPDQESWAHLSGGLDSSSVVCVAAHLHRHGEVEGRLGGTITVRDTGASGDDAQFVDLVTQTTEHRSEIVSGFGPWNQDGLPPPEVDSPSRDYPFFSRQRHVSQLIRSSGGRWLLSGIGPDEYFPYSPGHLADLVWTAQWREAYAELVNWAVASRQSALRLVAEDIVLPLMPVQIERTVRRMYSSTPRWLKATFAKRSRFAELRGARLIRSWQRGQAYGGRVHSQLAGIAQHAPSWWLLDGVRVCHPLLDVDLVEHVLRLPRSHRTDYRASKPILRRATKGIVPDAIRYRASKGWNVPSIVRGFAEQRPLIASMLQTSILAEMGCIEPKELLQGLDDCVLGKNRDDFKMIYCALSLETWLSVRDRRTWAAA